MHDRNTISDEELISAILDPELKSHIIKEFYDSYRISFMKFAKAHYKVGDSFACEIYQEAYYHMYTNFIDGRVKKLKSSLKTYLFSIGKNLILNELKRTRSTQEYNEIIEDGELPELEIIEAENDRTKKLAIIRDIVSGLKDPCKSILTKFYWGKKKLIEILKLMPRYTTIDSLKAQKSRCLKQLEGLVKSEFDKMSLTV
ncbi:MAG: sigma-70 family RNA polymerase sigma factor [Lentimicrobium sp.]